MYKIVTIVSYWVTFTQEHQLHNTLQKWLVLDEAKSLNIYD